MKLLSLVSFLINFQISTGEAGIPEIDKRFVPFVTILSGGIKVSVTGRNLNSSTQSHLRAIGRKGYEVEWSNQEPCEIVSDVEVKCRTPKLSIPETTIQAMKGSTINHNLPLNLSNFNQVIDFSLITNSLTHQFDLPVIYLDPFIEIFQDEHIFVTNRDDKRIFIQGAWPRWFPQLADNILILVGGKECQHVKMVNESHVSCTPHTPESHVIKFGGDDVTKLPVRVRVGNAEYMLGTLKFEFEESIFHPIPVIMLVFISIIIITSIFFSIHAKCASKKCDKFGIEKRIVKAEPSSREDRNKIIINNNNNDDDDDDDGGGDNNSSNNNNKKSGTMERGEAHELEPFLSPVDKRIK